MASIISIQKPIIAKGGSGSNLWKVTLRYTLGFTDFEVKSGMKFRDEACLMEDDDSSDDVVSGWHSPGNFDPGQTQVSREVSFTVDESALNTEGGFAPAEELYARVRLINLSVSFPPTKDGPVLVVSV